MSNIACDNRCAFQVTKQLVLAEISLYKEIPLLGLMLDGQTNNGVSSCQFIWLFGSQGLKEEKCLHIHPELVRNSLSPGQILL